MGRNNNSSPQNRIIDFNSIKTTTLLSFVLFAVILIAMVWGLTTSLMNKYYENTRLQTSYQLASTLEEQLQLNPMGFDQFAADAAKVNDIYIRLDTPGDSLIYDGTGSFENDQTINRDIKVVRERLKNSTLNTITLKRVKGANFDSRLLYASYIETFQGRCTLFLIAPLYADAATVNVISKLLFYISIFVLMIAFALAMFLSNRLASPIENITRSAKELSMGNHDVKFNATGFTETKELARTLNQASYEMQKTEFYQREILANVSHDLKTPLTMIRSYAEKIIDISGNNPEKRESDLHVIISETERLNRLVTEMMPVSRLQSDKIELHRTVFNLVDAAQEVFDSFVVLRESDGYDLQFHPCKAVYVDGDRDKLMQVMSNFISNAVKYSQGNKFVDVQLKRVGKKVVFHCVDHGVGIPSDELQHVWDRYYRTSANHERDIEGTGLGLSIVKGILNIHGANFGVESQEGRGSDFWFEMETVRKPPERDNRNNKQ